MQNWLADRLIGLARWIDRLGMSLKRCPNCGENPYTGEPCFKRTRR